ncbi:Rieske (2Fe-2S) protein [Nostocoides sp. Soil756]|uniref:Rieske (2Fe-2S) protein n=1 Tax=Nostocoides sp. Soil756 TaxID=1736399 RepID=UPI0006F85580|nr:Rieske (2Fe-2S) protein [Tetrasphaera sp. Soil756]KRE62729.1 hypothetical protein ASG78_06990 [Tetrasphaera sp. Soil756]
MSTDPATPVAPRCGCARPTRRQTLRAAGAVGATVAGVGALTACGAGQQVGAAASSAASAVSGVLKAADVPVGGGKILESLQVVVTQPSAGEFKAFSSVCTHAGCQVGSVRDNLIICPCHGSQFDAATGAVRQGPASQSLPEKSVTVSGDGITVT